MFLRIPSRNFMHTRCTWPTFMQCVNALKFISMATALWHLQTNLTLTEVYLCLSVCKLIKKPFCVRWRYICPLRYEDILWSGRIDLCLLNLGTSCRWVVSFTPRPLYPWGNRSIYPLERRRCGSKNRNGWLKILDPTEARTPTTQSSSS
jgi:hypothetical protein